MPLMYDVIILTVSRIENAQSAARKLLPLSFFFKKKKKKKTKTPANPKYVTLRGSEFVIKLTMMISSRILMAKLN